MPWSNQGSNGGNNGSGDGPGKGPDKDKPSDKPASGGSPPHNPWGQSEGIASGSSSSQSSAGKSPAGKPGSRPQPGLEDAVRQSGERLRVLLGGGGRNGNGGGNGGRSRPSGPSGSPFTLNGWGTGRVIGVGVAAVAALWLATGVYRVAADEQGVVLRFGKPVRVEQPGLRYHLPAPIEQVLLPQVTRVNRIEIGYRSQGDGRRSISDRDVADESTMLTGDENIVDIDFAVFWVIKDPAKFLFNIREPEETVKKVAESAMREIIGRTEIQPALTDARQRIENDSRQLLQTILDQYQAGIEITQVQLQRVEPPPAVVEAFNDVQRARQDRERLRNEAETYRNDIIPRARGDAERLNQEAQAYRDQVVDLAQGDAKRFQQVLEAYAQAPDAASRRLYIETMEQILKGTHKILLDDKAGGGAVPYLPLNDMLKTPTHPATPAAPATSAK
ncbi:MULTISPECIES: FtsH protease activity modulator HflK [Nitrospirillum]|uniref:Protein HflK n=1 Tax=Nitrospirillum amazonense TaxID=28077 RepID=A0A560FRJ1_9PROT|nr:FtsH protease activity modulator HflK [Nitrospirillum amazonense]MEC4591524.1 FtsH protease activity modulator HflK [Nitrospirillum amazonense]TWB24247.1 protease FtsH subunit HflK [Nitrospirillum amazonense]